MSASAYCRSCGASIEWVRTTKGKMMPLDAAGTPDGNVTVVDGVAHVHPGKGQGDRTSHFVTCPNALDWRKR